MKLGLALVACVGACVAAFGCKRAPDKQCRTDADELTRWLGTLNLEPRLFMLEGTRLVRRGDLGDRRLVEGPVVTIGADRISFRGELFAAARSLEGSLAAARQAIADEVAQGRPPPEPRRLHLLVDEAAPWERVVAVVEAAHRAGFTIGSFPFTPPAGPSTRPPRTAFDDRMDALERDLAAGELTTASAPPASGAPIFARCPAADRVFVRVGAMETGDKAEAIVRGLGPALIDCGCEVDLPLLRSMLWHMLNNATPVRGIAVELDPGAPPLALPAGTPWREASKLLAPTTGRAWFAIRG